MKNLTIVSTILFLVTLTGCVTVSAEDLKEKVIACNEITKSTDADSGVALIVAPTSNFTSIENAVESSEGPIKALLDGNTSLITFLASGDTSLTGASQIDLSQSIIDAVKKPKIKLGLKSSLASLRCALDAGNQSPELDILKALKSAYDSLPSGESIKNIILVSNGLQTSGDFKMQESFDAEVVDIVSSLQDSNALPKLTGSQVTFIGLGQVSGEQPILSLKSVNKLQNIWKALVEASGGTVIFSGAVDLGQGNPTGPEITLISPLVTEPIVESCQTVLTDDNLTFFADSAEFISPKKALETFQQLSLEFSAQKCKGTISVTGFTTNSGTGERQQEIATARAEAVARGLAKLFPSFPQEINGVGYDGTGDLDASNRRVEVVIKK